MVCYCTVSCSAILFPSGSSNSAAANSYFHQFFWGKKQNLHFEQIVLIF